MDIHIRGIPYNIDELTLTRHLADTLHHNPGFQRYQAGGLLNFKVFLFQDKKMRRHAHSGSGVFTLPQDRIAMDFLDQYRYGLRIAGQTISFQRSNKPPRPDVLEEIRLMPYRDPEAIRQQQDRLATLSETVHLDDVQYAWQCRDYTISTEWHWREVTEDLFRSDLFYLHFKDETREFIIRNTPRPGRPEYFLRVRYARITSTELDSSSRSILLQLESAPVIESQSNTLSFNPFNGILERIEAKRERLAFLGTDHGLVAPYTWVTLRLVCRSLGDLGEFRRMAEIANIEVQDRSRTVERRALFAPRLLSSLLRWLQTLDYFVAFQCEALHKGMLLDTAELLAVRSKIEDLVRTRGSDYTVAVMREFRLRLQDLWYQEGDSTVNECLSGAIAAIQEADPDSSSGMSSDNRLFNCLHVSFTPTVMRLRGPFPDTSNRILI